jgi:class 3 adenylate cyclase/tetratricopeptide (TPR) repeat protein
VTTCGTCGAATPADARFCPACGAEQDSGLAASEERKVATVVFADLVGSTALAHGEDPERVRARLERFYRAMTEEIERTGGTVESFAGDSVMAAFGVPAALEDHAERALHAALAMHSRLAELFGDELQLRIGVNTGDVVVGQAHQGGSFVTGDVVNVAARLEQAARAGEVLAGERTVAVARGAFEFSEPRVLEAKGKPDGVVGCSVLRALTLARPRGVAGFRRVFVGRAPELNVLQATFRRAFGLQEPHLVTVVGEPGVGKTTLVRELWELVAEERSAPLRRTGRCLPYGDGITYWPLGEILKEHFGILESDSPDEVVRRLDGREILGLALGLDVAPGLHPVDAREELHEAAVRFVEELAAERPAVCLVEDVHWAEDDFLDLLERVAREARARVVLLATARPELLDRRPGWGGGRRNATTIWLEPLQEDDAARMLDELLDVALPDELRRLLVRRSEGNPFFVEELVAELADAGVVERSDGGWVVRELPADFAVPDSIFAVLAARIDRLPALEKAALQAASVVGRAFWPGPVVHLLDGEEPDLELLEERDFVRRRSGSTMAGEREYSFKHALTREVAYTSIPKARRGRLHATLAEWLETKEFGREEHASLLAYHYAEAVRPEDADLVWEGDAALPRLRGRAVFWLRRAGELARGRYEMEEAIELFSRAIALCDEEHPRALLWRELGHAHAMRYDGEAMRIALLRALDGPLDDDERASTYALLAFQASIRSAMWSIRLNRALIEEWAAKALELAPQGSDAHARALLALANIAPEEVSDDVLERASELADGLGNRELRSYALGARSQTAFERGRFDEALELTQRRLELLEEIDDPDHLSEGYESAVPVAVTAGRFDEAERLWALHRDLTRRLSPHHRVHSVGLALEHAEARGDWETILASTDRVLDAVARNLSTPCVRNPRGLLICALAHACTGDEVRAVELEREAVGVAGQGYETLLAAPRLRAAIVRGDRALAEALLEHPLERSYVWGPGVFAAHLDALVALGKADRIEQEAAPFLGPGLYLEPFALRALGAARRDDDLLARADERFAALGLEWHRAQTERLLAGIS